MGTHKSAIKRHRQSLKRREHNRSTKHTIRSLIRKARVSLKNGEGDPKSIAREAERALAKAAGKGTMHKKNAARRISRLHKAANKPVK